MKILFTFLLIFAFTAVAYTVEPPENILKNGDFDLNLEHWHNWAHADAIVLFQIESKRAEPVVGKNAVHVAINNAGDAIWHIQFYQQPFTLEKNTTYTYSLWAKSEKPRSVVMRILHQGDPWNEYARQKINLSEEWKEFFITFQMPDNDANSRAGVIMGTEKADVWLDHIRLYVGKYVSDIEGAEPHPVEPADKLATTWARLKQM